MRPLNSPADMVREGTLLRWANMCAPNYCYPLPSRSAPAADDRHRWATWVCVCVTRT